MSLENFKSTRMGAIAIKDKHEAELAAHLLKKKFPESSVRIEKRNAFFVFLDDEILSPALLEARVEGGYNGFCVALGWEPN